MIGAELPRQAEREDPDAREPHARVVVQVAELQKLARPVVEAVDAGEHDVDEHDVGGLGVERAQRLLAVLDRLHHIALLLEQPLEHPAQRGLIIRHEDAVRAGLSSLGWTRGCAGEG